MQPANLQHAEQFAIDHETPWDREVDGVWGVHPDDPSPWNRLLGPVHGRGPVSGVITRAGRRLTSWGEPDRADLTFSIAKTYLALLAGAAAPVPPLVARGVSRSDHAATPRERELAMGR